jgi:hypothetical protein
MAEITLTILGEAASKANSRRAVRIGKSSRIIKSAKALDYSKTFRAQLPEGVKPLEQPCVAHITIWYASRRPDLDESLILDLLQVDEKKYKDTKGVILNDRQVREKHVYWRLDPANPRCEIQLVEQPDLDLASCKKGKGGTRGK